MVTNVSRRGLVVIFAVVLGAVVLLLVSHTDPVGAFQTGQVLHNGNPGDGGYLCTECHTGGLTEAAVEITGPGEVPAGEQATFTMTVSGGAGAVGGFNVSTTDHLGSFAATGSDTRVFFNEMTHTEPKPYANASATFEFTWTAPDDEQDIVLYAAGMAGDGDGTTSGDSVASTTLAVTVAPALLAGDADSNGMVDAADVMATLLANLGRPPVGFDPRTADMNDDDVVGLIDALLLARNLPA